MTITIPPQCFAIFIFLFGFIGFLQGWRRSVVLMGFTLAAILFLQVGVGNYFATFIFVVLPETIHTLTGGFLFSSSMPPPSPTQVLITKLIFLVVAIVLGFVIGGNAFKATPEAGARFLGILSGFVTGFAIVTYVSSLFTASQTLTIGVTTPALSTLSSTMFIGVLVIIAVIAIIIGLLTTRLGK
jgi:hypothetical protein